MSYTAAYSLAELEAPTAGMSLPCGSAALKSIGVAAARTPLHVGNDSVEWSVQPSQVSPNACLPTATRTDCSTGMSLLARHLWNKLDNVTSQVAETTEYLRRELADVKRDLREIKTTVKEINTSKNKQTNVIIYSKPTYSLMLSMLAYRPTLMHPSEYLRRCWGSGAPTFQNVTKQFQVQLSPKSQISNWISTLKTKCKRKRKSKLHKGSSFTFKIKTKLYKSKPSKISFELVFLTYEHKMIKYLKIHTALKKGFPIYSKKNSFFNFCMPNKGTKNFIEYSNEYVKYNISEAIDNFCPNNDNIIRKLNKKCHLDRKVNVMNAMNIFCTENKEILERLNSMKSCLLNSNLHDFSCHNSSFHHTNQRIVKICDVMIPPSVQNTSVGSDSEVENNIYGKECNSDCSEKNILSQHIRKQYVRKQSEISIKFIENVHIAQLMPRVPLRELDLYKNKNILNNNAWGSEHIVDCKNEPTDLWNGASNKVSNTSILLLTNFKVRNGKKPESLKTFYSSQSVGMHIEPSMIFDVQKSSSNIPVSLCDFKIKNIISRGERNRQFSALNKSVNTLFCADITHSGPYWKIKIGPNKNCLFQYQDFIFIKYTHKQALLHSSTTFLDLSLLFNSQMLNVTRLYQVVKFNDSFKGLLKEYFTLVDVSSKHDVVGQGSLYSKYSSIMSKSPTKFAQYLMYLFGQFMRKDFASCRLMYGRNEPAVGRGVGCIFIFVNSYLVKELMPSEYELLFNWDD